LDLSVPVQHSLKTRIVASMLGIFLIGIWGLETYVSGMLLEDVKNMLSEQQFSTVSFIAADINNELQDRIRTLEEVAGEIGPTMLGNTEALQTFLSERPLLKVLFGGGLITYRLDGKEITQVPLSNGRSGVESTNRDHLIGPLKEGRPGIGKPYLFKSKRYPEFAMAVPIRDAQGEVIGALAGVMNLAKNNFLNDVSGNTYGKSGGYLLIAPQYRLIVTASDKNRIMERLPEIGNNPVIDRFSKGYEGSAIMVNPHGLEVLVSVKEIPVVGWKMAAILPTAEAFAPILAMKQRMLLATIFLTLLVGGLIWWILKRQLAPMLATARILGAMSNTDQPLQSLPVLKQDELGQLVKGFNHLLDVLGERGKALMESERLLRESQRHAGLGSYVLNFRTGLWAGSAVLDGLFGIDETYDHSIEGWTALIHPDDRAMMTTYFKDEILGQGRDFDKVYRIIRRDSLTVRWVHGLGRLEYDDKKLPLELHGTVQDISERKQSEDALRESHCQLRELTSSLQTVREQERTALARELHDELGQQLLRLRMDLSWLASRTKDHAQALHEKVEGMKHFIDGSVDSLRHLTTELRLPLLDDLGLAAAALWVVNDFSKLTGIEVGSNIAIDNMVLDEQVTINVFRILQESLTNVARHSRAKRVFVALTRVEEGLVLEIRDNGHGTELPNKPKLGHGLVGIRERVLLLGGVMEIASANGEGFAIHVRIPVATYELSGGRK